MALKKLILLLEVIKLINCLTSSELFTIFGDRNCIPGSLVSLTEHSKRSIEYFPDEFLAQETLITDSNDEDKSALSSLHELAQFNDISYFYELINTEGPPHSRIFTVTLNLGDEYFTSDDGMKSIKKAQQNAAIKALKNTQYQHPPLKIKENKRGGETLTTPSAALNNLATKLGLKVSYNLVTEQIIIESNANNNDEDLKLKQKSYLEKLNDTVHGNDSIHIRKDGDDSKGPFTVSVDVNGARFFGKAHTKQQARHEAASQALKSLKEMPEIFQCLNEDDNCKSKRKNINNKSPISLVYEEAQRRKLSVDFEIIDEIGPAHKKIFTTKCTVGEKLLESTGEGKSKKESKRKAAENILSDLLNLPEKTTGENSNNNAQENLKKKKKSKKNKVIKNTFDKIDKIFDNVLDFGKDLVGKFTERLQDSKKYDDDKRKGDSEKKNQFTPTEELLHYGKLLNINVQFSDFEENKKSYSLLDLNTKTSILCLGEGVNQKNSRDLASKYGLKMLYKLGLLDNLQKESKIISSGLNTEKDSKTVWFPTENVDKDEL